MLKFLDSFGTSPSLYIRQSSEYKTRVGGVITILVLFITVLASLYFGQEFIKKESPSVNFSDESDMHPKNLYYFDQFEFVITLQDPQEHPFINESIYFPKGYILKTKLTDQGTQNFFIPFNLERCSESPPKSQLFNELDLTNYYCLSKKQNFNLSELYVGEFWGNDGFQLLQVQFIACNKGENSSNCVNDKTIEDYLAKTKISVYLLDTLTQTRNFEKPFESVIRELFYYASKNSFLSITQYLRTLKISSDDGLIFTSYHSDSTFSLDKVQEYTSSDSGRTQFVNFNVQFTNVASGYYRKYYKFQDFVAQVGGIFKTVTVISHFLTFTYYKNSYNEYLINHFFGSRSRQSHQKKNESTNESFFVNRSNTITYKVSSFTDNFNGHISKFKKVKIRGIKKFLPFKFIRLSKLESKETNFIFVNSMNSIRSYLNVVNVLHSVHNIMQIKKFLVKTSIFNSFQHPLETLFEVNTPRNNTASLLFKNNAALNSVETLKFKSKKQKSILKNVKTQ